jgi:CelD/BcsL family acetyltransferase involved in cellulose biosynthesis
MANAALFVESVGLEGAQARLGPWRELCGRALESNPFAEPAFLLNAARHLGEAPRLEFLLAWRDQSRSGLVGLIAMAPPRLAFGAAQIWQSEQAALPGLVLDREAAAQALAGFLLWLERERSSIAGLFAPTLPADGATVRFLQEATKGLTFLRTNARQRAILPVAKSGGFEDSLPGRRLKEWRRLRRRLEERGAVRLITARESDAFEKFLLVEAKGWKGRRGAPLAADPRRAAFARAMASDMASQGKLHVYCLELDDAPIAVGVVLTAADRAFYWKTTFDERLAEYSPGVLLTLDLSRIQERDPGTAVTDSCAIEGHPMIDRLWPGRLSLVDCLIAVRPGAETKLKLWLAQREFASRAKEGAKRLLFPLVGRRRS